ncbi:hypothetical protein QE385_003997 [Sphingomonas sp. SORGH_AS 950]|uniref:hypothetical protein n=1 Tax=Sphingomonas sp. SORGH_AS_0950 TaxID=3041792 RepID=UPI0027881DD9|nr:hypothetical protein [Sphingomonas sp. SORGH_AS_0950]MDQ1159600.1 hypothetical protein [Sphingomonas sp. SORGH_AS_0950]
MKNLIPILALLTVCGCQQEVAAPTAQELIDNREMLATWQSKCDSGEYSHLEADEKARKCSTTRDATISVTQAAEGKKASDFFKANTIRK